MHFDNLIRKIDNYFRKGVNGFSRIDSVGMVLSELGLIENRPL